MPASPPAASRWPSGEKATECADKAHEWPRAWYGVKGYFRWLESKAYKMHVRVFLSKYRGYALCPDCRGQRLRAEARAASATPNRDPDHGELTVAHIPHFAATA